MRLMLRIAVLVLALGGALLGAREVPPPPRVAVFHGEGFPDVDTPGVSDAVLAGALKGLPAEVVGTVEALRKRLASGVEVLVLAHGSAFPLEAWEAIRTHLERGGGLVVLGGAPFHQPVLWQAGTGEAKGRWVLGQRQPTFARELLLGPGEELSTAGLGDPLPVEGSAWSAPGARPGHTFALTVRFTTKKDQPGEDGSAGPREAVLRPLLHLLDGAGLPRACALLEIHRLRGAWAGGRWVLATSDAALDGTAIRAMVDRALEGPSLFEARPVNASLEAGEIPRFRLNLLAPRGAGGAREALGTLRDGAGRTVAEGRTPLDGAGGVRVGELILRPRRALAPGLYHLRASLPGTPWAATCGLWVKDGKLLAQGPVLTASRDWLRLDGKVLPVVGTTYMASDVHRKFLFEPDPELWDRDFARMERLGVNFVRTGLWTAWNRIMLDPGAVDDGVLRALDAFVQSAARHHLHVCFNFFAFLPPAFTGENPYLSPQALEGQKVLLATVARRFRGCPWVHYDLINEPSYATAETLWTNRPRGDRFEREAWWAWIGAHRGSDLAALRDRWRDGSDDVFGVPTVEELSATAHKEGRRPRKALDFRAFTQDVFAGWAREMRNVLREAGGDVLVTVGQDEAGLGVSPSHQLMAPFLDYTAMHSWWLNDDLLWDGAGAKVPGKPMLIQETGLMRLEDLDGAPWCSPEVAARLLERKFAFAFAARGTGAVEWAWDINPYQPLENEAVIGFFRPDGTAKEELRVLAPVAAFFREAAPYLEDYAPDPVVVVLPQDRVFAGRAGGAEAPRRLVRVLADRLGIVPTCLVDRTLTAEALEGARLILVPTPELLDEGACGALEAALKAGSAVLVTGAVTGDAGGRVSGALERLGLADPGRPLAVREPSPWGWATFDGNLGERLRRSLAPALGALEGRLWHEPLPLEFAREEEPLVHLLAAALGAAGVPVGAEGDPVASRVLELPRAHLIICINETQGPLARIVKAGGRAFRVPLAPGRTRMLLVERASGRILAATPGEPVEQP